MVFVLTGSKRGGQAVAKAAGANLKKSSMELGGSDAFVVLADADIDEAVNLAWRVRLYNAGQVCTSSKRFIVAADVYDDFLAKLKERFAKLVPGDPMDPQTTLAPMNSKRAKEKLQDQVNLKKSSMELGGSDAFVVLADADIDEAVNLAWRVRLYNAGQVCTSSKRFIVAADVYDDFLAKLKERFAKLVPGDPMDPQTTLAPIK
ncbi:hypothetical protein WP50_30060 [Lactiplantibacillus plantarum]|nr:hypothetical protein WP50_30060 [Lactiplantibacillus plantarum]